MLDLHDPPVVIPLLLQFMSSQHRANGGVLLAVGVCVRNTHVEERILAVAPKSPGPYVESGVVFKLRGPGITGFVHHRSQHRLALNVVVHRLEETAFEVADVVVSGVYNTLPSCSSWCV